MLPTSAPVTVQRKPAAPRSVMTSRSRSGHSARQRAGVANSAARTSGGTARNVSSTTSTDGTPDSYHPDRDDSQDGRFGPTCVSTACPPPSASPTTRTSSTRCSPTPRATSPRSPTAAAAPTGSGRDVTAGAFAAEVTAVARGLIAAGVAAGRPGGAAVAHPLRVDAGRLRDPRRRRGHRADLRDLLGRADRLDPVRLGRGRGRRGDGQARRARRAGARRARRRSRCGGSSPRATSRARWSGSWRGAPTCRSRRCSSAASRCAPTTSPR